MGLECLTGAIVNPLEKLLFPNYNPLRINKIKPLRSDLSGKKNHEVSFLTNHHRLGV